MANIYSQQKITLGDLLKRTGENSTILIPNLQRPYIWDPKQVTLLVDSLIRGWPFGTLLTWRIAKDQKTKLPSRSLWQFVDRVDEQEGRAVPEAQAPADFQMILDGQQRTQSLLLAFGSDEAGFKLTDDEWRKSLDGITKRGRKGNVVHWSKGSLCLNLEKFTQQYKQQGDDVRIANLDFTKCLDWIVTDEKCGRNKESKPSNYKYPIAERNEGGNRHLRLFRLWNLVGSNANDTYKQFLRKIVTIQVPKRSFSAFAVSESINCSIL